MTEFNGRLGRDQSRSGDWTCGCGQTYRVLAEDGEVRMWPKNSADGFRVDPIGEHCVCGERISRGTVLSALFGANVPGVSSVATLGTAA